MTEQEQVSNEQLQFDPPKELVAHHLDEIPLIFAKNVRDIEPKRGLSLHGPVDSKDEGPETIRVGIVSSSEGIETVTNWIIRFNDTPIYCDGKQPFLTQTFPGYVKAFNARLVVSENFNEPLTTREISEILGIKNPNLRIKRAAEKYASKVQIVARRTPHPDLIICHEPTDIEMKCGAGLTRFEKSFGGIPKAARDEAERIRKRMEGVSILFPLEQETIDLLDSSINQDFRAYLKAKTLEPETPPIQILTESALQRMLRQPTEEEETNKIKRGSEDPSNIAWNLATGIYCKANHLPWKVDNLKWGTCYVGISFYFDKTSRSKDMQASLAQIFSDTGEGLVVRSNSFKWDLKSQGSPHLSYESAFNLLNEAVEIYKIHHNDQPPNRVVIHKKSSFDGEELEGFLRAIQDENVPKFDFLTLGTGSRDIFLYRNGDNPVLRGTSLTLNRGSHLLFTIGYIPYLNSYPHPRIPHALEIREHHGDSSIEELSKEILALSRLNWNSAGYCSYWPVTLMFSQRVGDILGRIDSKASIQRNYYYYM